MKPIPSKYGIHGTTIFRLTLWDIARLLVGKKVEYYGTRLWLWGRDREAA